MVLRRQCELCNNYDEQHAKDCPIRIADGLRNSFHEIHWGVRCFNGAFDGRTTRVHEFQDLVMEAIKKRRPDACCTYFPAPGYTMVHEKGREISGEHSKKAAALEEAFWAVYPELEQEA